MRSTFCQHCSARGPAAASSGRLCNGKDRGDQSMSLWVLRDNPYRRFYDRVGGEVLADEKQDDFSGRKVTSVAYGWRDLDALSTRLGEGTN
jgi:hypothetical protein